MRFPINESTLFVTETFQTVFLFQCYSAGWCLILLVRDFGQILHPGIAVSGGLRIGLTHAHSKLKQLVTFWANLGHCIGNLREENPEV